MMNSGFLSLRTRKELAGYFDDGMNIRKGVMLGRKYLTAYAFVRKGLGGTCVLSLGHFLLSRTSRQCLTVKIRHVCGYLCMYQLGITE